MVENQERNMQGERSLSDRVKVEIAEGVAQVTLNRPDKLNALDPGMFEAIIAAGENLSRTASLRAVVLAGAGEGFCAGLDKASFATMASGDGRREYADIIGRTHGIANAWQQVTYLWRTLPVPVVAAIHGSRPAAAFRSRSAPTSATSRRMRGLRSSRSNGVSCPIWAESR
jgi:enoyl-CoA hydratase/carnithine racemase